MINYTLEDVIAANSDADSAKSLASDNTESAAAITLAYMKQAEAEGRTPYDVTIEAVQKYGWKCGTIKLENGFSFSQDGIDMPKSVKQRFSTCRKAYDRGVVFANIDTFSELTPKNEDDPRVKAIKKWAAQQVKDNNGDVLDALMLQYGIDA
jgi:hypothetical protein